MKNLFKRVPRGLLITLGVLVAIRMILPFVLLSGVNWALANKGGVYNGHLDDLDLSLYRGAYQFQGLEIRKKGAKLPPLIYIKELDISLAWRGLLQGKFLLDAVVDGAAIRLIDGENKENQQYGLDEDKKVQKNFFDLLFPISIESMKVRHSAVYFNNNSFEKALPVSLEQISFDIEDLRTHTKNNLSPFRLEALLQKHASLFAQGRLDVMTQPFRADIDLELTKFKVSSMNDVMRIYVPIDLTNGTLDLYAEAAVARGEGKGYANVFLNDIDVVAGNQHFISLKHFFFEIIGGVGNWFLKNPKTKTLAFKLPFEVKKGEFEVDKSKFWDSIWKNRRGEFSRGIEKSILLEKLTGQSPQKVSN